MAGPFWRKFSGLIQGIGKNVWAKEFFEKIEK